MQFDHASFPEGSAPSSQAGGAAGPHPSPQPHPHPHPHPSAHPHPHAHPHAAPQPHYPYTSRFGGSYSFFSWPRVGFWGGYNPAFAPPAFAGAGAAPPPPPPPPHSYPHYSPWSRGDYRAWRRSQRCGPRILPFLLLGGGGIYAYKKLQREVRDVKAAVAASDEQAAAVLAQREADRWGHHRHHHGWGGWREQETKWAEWQALMAQQRARQQQPSQASPGEVPRQEEKPASKWV
ncbi:hypothetical protein JCM6882_007496 [Rhodosporidiobolus microsporus]